MDQARHRQIESRLWASLGTSPDERWLDLSRSGTTVRALVAGEGAPVVFVHGGAVGASSWASLVSGLEDRYQCIAIERPGCGLSPALGSRLASVDAMAAFYGDFFADVLDALDVSEAFVVGTSLGGFVSIHAAAANPQRVRRLVLLGSVFGADLDNIPLVMRIGTIEPIGRAMAKMPANKAAARMMLRQIGLKDAMAAGRVSVEMVDWFLSNMRDTDTLVNEAATNPRIIDLSGMAADAVIGDDVLATIQVPTMLIWGGNDPMGSTNLARSFAARIPGAELDIWPGVGHAPWLDHPDRAAESISNFFGS